MHVLITGGTGFVGTKTTQLLLSHGYKVTIATRQSNYQATENIHYVSHDPLSGPFPAEAFNNRLGKVTAVINLMGENIGAGRWSDKQKKKITESRLLGTQNLVTGIENHLDALDVFISASAIGIYPANRSEELDESTTPGKGFLPDLCRQWEEVANGCSKAKRLINLRIGVVLGKGGGALAKLLPIYKLGGGGPIGSGKAIMSWVHVQDLARILHWLLENNITGPVNAVAQQDSNYQFGKELARALHRPYVFPVPPFMLKLLFGEMASIILDSQNVIATVLKNNQFVFHYPTLEKAMQEVAS